MPYAKLHILDLLTYAGDIRRLENCLTNKNVFFHRGDICDRNLVDSLMSEVSAVVHFAAESHVDRSIDEPDVFVRTNVLGTHNLMNSALQAGVRFILVSTDEVYGSTLSGSFDEDSLINPSSPYSATKAAAELIALSLHKTHGLDLCITRAANNFGKYQNREKLIPLVISKLQNKQKVPIYGDGSNVRNWLHITDHCEAILMVLNDGIPGQIYNIGSEESYTNNELVLMILSEMGLDKSYIEYVSDRNAHDFRYSINSNKILNHLGWFPKFTLRDSLGDLVRENIF